MKKYFVSELIIISLIIFGCSKEHEVVTGKSGLKYQDKNIGEGRIAKAGDLISIHFRGWIISDSSDLFSDWSNDTSKSKYLFADTHMEGETVNFVLGEYPFVRGTLEGIEGMQSGGERVIIIPSELAYGKQGNGPIPPDTDLRVSIEMLNVRDKIVAKIWDIEDKEPITTSSGLNYVILEPGEGKIVEDGNVVTLHYSGFFENGNKFDSSVERDKPFSFVVGNRQVIAGLDEGIRLLKKGGKAKFIIPPQLAYGSTAIGSIPPNSTLIFDAELLDVK